MITFTSGNMFDTPADIRINTVNCVGVMGAGLALAFKTKYPEMFREYQKACKTGEVKPGKLHVWNKLFGDCIINFPTKRHWREPSRYEDIEAGLIALRKYLADKGKVKVLLPAVGCGHGGLEWNRISEMIKKQLANVESEIIVFTPEDSRAAGDKIKDHEDAQIQDRLDAEGIKVIEPGHDLYPESLRGRTAAKLYVKGNPEKLNVPLLTIMPSPKPTQQEIDAAAIVIETVMRPGITLLIGYGASIERPAIKKALEKGVDVVVILSEGILDFRVRKDLLDVWDDNRIVVISATKPLERWSPSTAFRAKDLQLSLASAAIIVDAEPQLLSKMLIQKASLKHPFIYYVDYGKRDTNIINTFNTIKAQSLAINDLSDPKHYEAIISIFGANELSQPMSEKHIEAISAPIAEHRVTNEYETRNIKGPEAQTTGGAVYPKRLIEVDLPIKRISEHARREKSIRHGHISTLHIWWARRPLASCRAVICAALWPDPADPLCPEKFKNTARQLMMKWADQYFGSLTSTESINRFVKIQKKPDNLNDDLFLRQTLLDFIADFSNWDNSTVKEYLETSRALTQAAHEALGGAIDTRPLVLDPFCGGGAIPLEALRVGADAFASDLNPIPVLLNKVLLEYIPKYGKRLADEVRKWGAWVKREAENELSMFYPQNSTGGTPIAYLWARTIQCEGPGCGAEVPLMRSLWLAKKVHRSVALQLISKPDKKHLYYRIIVKGKNNWIDQDDPKFSITNPKFDGTVKRGSITCPCCGYTTPVSRVREQLKNRKGGTRDARMFCVVESRSSESGRFYRIPGPRDIEGYEKACGKYQSMLNNTKGRGYSQIPDELFSGLEPRRIPLPQYGITGFRDLFSPRSAIVLTTLSEKVIDAADKMKQLEDPLFANAITTCLAFAVDRIADQMSSIVVWASSIEVVTHTFGRQALPMAWDYVEPQPFAGSGGDFGGAIEWIAKVCEKEGLAGHREGNVRLMSADQHGMPDDSSDAVITDPPYYYSVPYADLSDFFYVWLKRTCGKFHPELFQHSLTCKKDEIIQNLPHSQVAHLQKKREFYEKRLQNAFQEARRINKPGGIGVIVFAHSETDAWEAMLNATINAGWMITASWPIDTERAARVIAQRQSTLASSVHLVCRPRENPDGSVRMDDIGDWRDVLAELPKRIHAWMPRLAEEGVVGADAIFACLGPALEIFSRYSKVEKASGVQVALKEYLEQVWAVVAKEALNVIFEGADTSGFEEDARLTAMWLWTLNAGAASLDTSVSDDEDDDDNAEKPPKAKLSGYMIEYDTARKIAQGLGAHLERLQSLVEVKGDKARLLPVSERTKSLFGKDESETPVSRRKKKTAQLELGFIEEIEKVEQEGSWGQKNVPQLGNTRLDRLHQSMILFAAGRSEALKRFLVEEGVGHDQRFWRLAQALSALYPSISDEKRWVDGVLARKKGLGF